MYTLESDKPIISVRKEGEKRYSPLEIELKIPRKVGFLGQNIGGDGVAMPLSFVNDPQFLNALLDYIKVGDKRNSKKDYEKREKESEDDGYISRIENSSELYDKSNLAVDYQARMKSLSNAYFGGGNSRSSYSKSSYQNSYQNLSYGGCEGGGSYSKN